MKIRLNTNCAIFCQTMKRKCNIVCLIFVLLLDLVVSFLTSPKRFLLGLYAGNLFFQNKEHYLVLSTVTLGKNICLKLLLSLPKPIDAVRTARLFTVTNVECHQQKF